MRIPLPLWQTSNFGNGLESTRLVSISDGRNRDTKTKNQSIKNTGTNHRGFSAVSRNDRTVLYTTRFGRSATGHVK